MRSSRPYLPAIVLAAGLILTGATAHFAHKNGSLTLDARFDRLTEEIRTTIESRILTYQNAVLQARGLIQIYPEIDRQAFKTYTENMNLAVEYPGVMGLGYIQTVPLEKRAEIEAKIQEEYKNSGLKVWPKPSPSDEGPLQIVRFFEPEMAAVSGQSLMGFNVRSSPLRGTAFRDAMESGQIVLSPPLHLLQDPSVDKIGYVLVVPIYRPGRLLENVEQRNRANIGFVYTAFRGQDLFEGIFERDFLNSFRISFDVHDPALGSDSPALETRIFGYEDQKMAASGRSPDSASHQRTFHIQIGNRPFLIRAFTVDGFIPLTTLLLPWLILVAGSALSFVVYGILKKNQRQADRILKSERQMSLVTNALPVLISYVDDQGEFQFVNQRFEDWFDRPKDSFIGATLIDVLPPKTHQQLTAFSKRALAGEALTEDHVLELANGRAIPAHSTFIPDFGSKGEVKGFIALVSDDSERKKQERNHLFLAELGSVLSASLDVDTTLNRFADLVVSSLADWCLIDLVEDDGHCRRVSAACADPMKFELIDKLKSPVALPVALPLDSRSGPAEVIRTGEPILHPTIDRGCLRSLVNTPALADTIEDLGFTSALMLPLKARNRVIGCVTLALSQSSRVYSENDVAFMMDVARRAALAADNAQLYKDAQRASRAKDEFLATLSHELRTPMNVILGWLEIMETERLDDETFQQALGTLNRNAHVQIQLINDLLDISRIISGKISLNVDWVDLGKISRSAIDGIRPAARNKNIALVSDIPDDECKLSCDGDRIQQILWNLLSNAVKFTPEGGEVRISVRAEDNLLQLMVEDTGQGIEPHFLPFVFDRFRQEDGSTTRSHGGLGLGLSIVRYLVELHGGRIEAHSRGRGKGARFTVTFPRNQEPGFASNTSSQARIPKSPLHLSPENTNLFGIHVLLIDDSSDVRALLKRILVRAGAQVTTATSAGEGFEVLTAREKPDVILSDIGLPEEDGFSFMRRYRIYENEQAFPRIPSAALTAYAQESDSIQALAAGFDCHIPKPVTALELVKAVALLAGRDQTTSTDPGLDAFAR